MLLEIKDICFGYTEDVAVLHNVSVTIKRGERVALVGHNGSGKSTLAKHLNGLLRPSQGEVCLDGAPISDLKVAQIAGMVSLLFQNPDDQICKQSVWDEIAFGPRNLGFDPKRVQKLVQESVAAFELGPVQEMNPHDLGFSRRKRLALASVVAMDASVVVLDEPTAGLDPSEIVLLEAVLNRLQCDGKTVLIISHDMDFIAENIERVICMESGNICFDGLVGCLFEDHALLDRCGLELPQVVRLCQQYTIQPHALTPEGVILDLINS
ncbi:energy-coupling factor ABC transporter ATP-binding protein [Pseudodesulfovibrio sediminis]|uniref:ABC transporter ATP-binding protein n=1 Tax=Pseudodesulfovibrio sediminis TaxID=2810563 RepID=A0ABM7P245_9BACT|nr:ABC transporter ATP-binding protein [Pseudodesulfovibrio sediminis]BCS86865.1 ABC transporter ATP-binding protein [Pseudodesulfovibrio sediminis]